MAGTLYVGSTSVLRFYELFYSMPLSGGLRSAVTVVQYTPNLKSTYYIFGHPLHYVRL